jgi:cation transport ATPase
LQEEDLVETLDDIGYSAQVQEPESSAERSFRHVIARFRIQGMTCSTCVGAVEHALTGVGEVTRAAVALATAEAEVEYDSRWAFDSCWMQPSLAKDRQPVDAVYRSDGVRFLLVQKALLAFPPAQGMVLLVKCLQESGELSNKLMMLEAALIVALFYND